jgi:phosphoribosylcarboxyaminoimidazole (NCAIR) mutase
MNYSVKMEIEIVVNSESGKDAIEYAADVVKSLGIDSVKVLNAERAEENAK